MLSVFNLKAIKTLSNFDSLNSKFYEISSIKIVKNNEDIDPAMKMIIREQEVRERKRITTASLSPVLIL